ncbi:hypothetical protein [Mycobacteroides abscessus]|uniref:hypothetical protein n=1 Tax=Mycobacteroides abscessus TaxID=36809 RepID=UPI001F3BB969|nr:hypothetical protein [Mycobacteroides abscessus]
MSGPSVGDQLSAAITKVIHQVVHGVIVGGTYAVFACAASVFHTGTRLMLSFRSEVSRWWRLNQQGISTIWALTLPFCICMYFVCASFLVPLPPDGTPRFALVATGAVFSCGIALGALGTILDHTQRTRIASYAWRALARIGHQIGNRHGWQSFSRTVESRWVPVALLAGNVSLAVFWPSTWIQRTFAYVDVRSPQWYVLVPLTYPLFLAFMTTMVIGFSGVVRRVYREHLQETFRRQVPAPGISWRETFPPGLNYTFGFAMACGLAGLGVQVLHDPLISNIFGLATIAAMMVWSIWVCIAAYHAERLYGPLIYLAVAVGVWALENFLATPSLGPITTDGWVGLGINVAVALCLFAVRTVAVMQSGNDRAMLIQTQADFPSTARLLPQRIPPSDM